MSTHAGFSKCLAASNVSRDRASNMQDAGSGVIAPRYHLSPCRRMRVLPLNALVVLAVPALAILGACGGSDSTTVIPTVTRVAVTGPSTTLTVGQSTTLSATAFGASGTQIPGAGAAAWSSSATAVASVDQAGKVTGVGPGSATISADIANVKGTFTLTVNAPVLAAKDTIFTQPTRWSPPFVTINVGGTVIFAFGGGIQHNAIFNKVTGAPADIGIFKDQVFARTFNPKGTFPFVCTIHDGMVGEITVQ